jgi:glycosyltransferase involved in cell wall biosynthesis
MTEGRRVAVVARSVFPLHGPGGLERSVYDLVRYLADSGVRVTLITRTPPRGSPSLGYKNISTKFIPYRTFPFAGRRGTTVIDRSTAYPLFGERAGRLAWTLVREQQIDIVHGFGASVLGYARRRDRATAPLVLNPQGLEEFGATDPSRARVKRAAYLPLRRAVQRCARAADRVIATDRVLEPAVIAHLHVERSRVRVIPNALDLPHIDRLASPASVQRVRQQSGIKAGDVVLLSVGRLEHNKGFHALAAALGALRDHAPRIAEGGWHWVVVGEGPYRRSIESAIAKAGIAGHTQLLGRVSEEDLHAWYEAADLFVHPSLYEGSSLVTLEAMAHRRAVVATTAGGLPDKVRPGVNGWLVPPGDVSALAAAISGALGQAERFPQMGEASRRIVEQEFSWAAAIAAVLRLYDELLR